MADEDEDREVGNKGKRGILVPKPYSGLGAFIKTDSQSDSQADPSLSFNPDNIFVKRQTREEVYPGGASIGVEYEEPRRATLDKFPAHEMVRDPDTGKITAVVYTQPQLDSLRQERADAILYFKGEIRDLVKRSVLTRKGTNSLEEFKRVLEIVKGTYFDNDPSADYEYTPEDFSKKSKLYLEDLIELNEEYIKLCKELLPEDQSQLASIQFAQNKLKRNLESLIELLTESVETEPGSEEVGEWNKSITKYQEMLRKLGEEGKAGVTEEADFGGRKKSKRRTVKRKLAKKSKTHKLKNKNKNKGKTSKKRSKRSRRR
jgi:hypothetical protein